MTPVESKRHERIAIDEAVTKRAGGYVDGPVSPEMSIPRLFGDQLIDAGRATVVAYYSRDKRRLDRAIRWMTKLVGGEP